MSYHDQFIRAAERLGQEHGANAAEWALQDTIGGRTPGDVTDRARAILRGIEDGDPEILDALPAADLSGQDADGWTVSRILEAIGADEPLEGEPDSSAADERAWFLDEIANAYEQGFNDAAMMAVESACAAYLAE